MRRIRSTSGSTVGAAAGAGAGYAMRDNLAEKMTADQKSEAEKLAKDWKPGVGNGK